MDEFRSEHAEGVLEFLLGTADGIIADDKQGGSVEGP